MWTLQVQDLCGCRPPSYVSAFAEELSPETHAPPTRLSEWPCSHPVEVLVSSLIEMRAIEPIQDGSEEATAEEGSARLTVGVDYENTLATGKEMGVQRCVENRT